jgi:hypothetical protein
MSANAAAEPVAASRITEQYEGLRRAALGGGLPVDARSGLALFLRRGMWGWAQAAALPSMPPPRARYRSSTSTAAERQQAVIHLFAAMAMRSTNRRDHERIAQGPVASSRA